ncbi:MAG TPA: DUF2867 domain-containing protein [Solirubrobacteraceae bacterium]|nr:DUF2867 domain-containing protein [Solirubrobacteraceae bacterium]
MRLPSSAHTSRPWRIHAVAHDFALEDVWALPTPGGPGDFPELVRLAVALDPEEGATGAAKLLWALRWKLGGLLGWDDEQDGIGGRVRSLRDRLPADLRATSAPGFPALPFQPLYVTDDELAAEIANATVHGVMHLSWVEDPSAPGGHRGQMAVLVKPNGLFGRAYMAAIKPFRHAIVYPQMLTRIERDWARARRRSEVRRRGAPPRPRSSPAAGSVPRGAAAAWVGRVGAAG